MTAEDLTMCQFFTIPVSVNSKFHTQSSIPTSFGIFNETSQTARYERAFNVCLNLVETNLQVKHDMLRFESLGYTLLDIRAHTLEKANKLKCHELHKYM